MGWAQILVAVAVAAIAVMITVRVRTKKEQQARKEKNFARADEIRAELLSKGIVLEDTREGVKWKRA